ncbi:MAG: hypothetical protein M1829_001443 [Trizodia sp. TS-e1964]|nr:MAG: hypothetical protein M1829_001443 [Trizodia sp. TS-e1964]
MHFAFPPRKSSHPPPYAPRPSSRPFNIRRSQLRMLALVACSIIAIVYLLSAWASGFKLDKPPRPPPGTPECVIVTLLDEEGYSKEYVEHVKQNRNFYAKQHGYGTFFPQTASYDLSGSPKTWARIPAMRHALTLFPHSTYFFFLAHNSLIMNSSLSLTSHIMNPARIESLVLKEIPVVPHDHVIKTFSHQKGEHIDLVLTQDTTGLSVGSFILRRGDWARFLLDSWFDPLLRSFNFQKADEHALEHIVQWHATILTSLALVPQRTMSSYNSLHRANDAKKSLYEDGDFVIHFAGCDEKAEKAEMNCEKDMALFYAKWKEATGPEIEAV